MEIDHLFLAFYNDTSLQGMKYLLKQSISKGYNPMIVVSKTQSNKVKDIHKKRIIYINLSIIRILTIFDFFKFDTFFLFKKYLFNSHKKNFLMGFKKIFWIKKFNMHKRLDKKLFEKYNPKVIYTCGDRTRSFEPSFLKLAELYKIPTVVVPISNYTCGKENLWKYRNKNLCEIHHFKKRDVTGLFSFKDKFKGQYLFHKPSKRYVSFYEPWVTEVMKEKGVLSDNPWQIGMGLSKYVCVTGKYEYKKFCFNKVPDQKLKITGNPETDVLYKNFTFKKKIKVDFLKKHNISKNEKLIIMALPQFKEHRETDNATHWKLINNICKSLSYTNCKVFISLHPKSKKEEYLFLENKYSLNIVSSPLCEILPIADIFIAGIGSTTTIWSILCEVPLLILNPLNLDYSQMYKDISGINFLHEMSQIELIVKELLNNPNQIDLIKKIFKKQKQNLSLFDGNCAERILNLENF